jgi:hypothetical protein
MLLCADACSRVGAIEQARQLYELLAPFSGQFAVSGAHVYGSIDWALAVVCTTLSQFDEAEQYFAAAAEIEGRLGAPLLLARTHTRWARALIARGRSGDLQRAQGMLEHAEHVVGRLGAHGISLEVAQCRREQAAAG